MPEPMAWGRGVGHTGTALPSEKRTSMESRETRESRRLLFVSMSMLASIWAVLGLPPVLRQRSLVERLETACMSALLAFLMGLTVFWSTKPAGMCFESRAAVRTGGRPWKDGSWDMAAKRFGLDVWPVVRTSSVVPGELGRRLHVADRYIERSRFRKRERAVSLLALTGLPMFVQPGDRQMWSSSFQRTYMNFLDSASCAGSLEPSASLAVSVPTAIMGSMLESTTHPSRTSLMFCVGAGCLALRWLSGRGWVPTPYASSLIESRANHGLNMFSATNGVFRRTWTGMSSSSRRALAEDRSWETGEADLDIEFCGAGFSRSRMRHSAMYRRRR